MQAQHHILNGVPNRIGSSSTKKPNSSSYLSETKDLSSLSQYANLGKFADNRILQNSLMNPKSAIPLDRSLVRTQKRPFQDSSKILKKRPNNASPQRVFRCTNVKKKPKLKKRLKIDDNKTPQKDSQSVQNILLQRALTPKGIAKIDKKKAKKIKGLQHLAKAHNLLQEEHLGVGFRTEPAHRRTKTEGRSKKKTKKKTTEIKLDFLKNMDKRARDILLNSTKIKMLQNNPEAFSLAKKRLSRTEQPNNLVRVNEKRKRLRQLISKASEKNLNILARKSSKGSNLKSGAKVGVGKRKRSALQIDKNPIKQSKEKIKKDRLVKETQKLEKRLKLLKKKIKQNLKGREFATDSASSGLSIKRPFSFTGHDDDGGVDYDIKIKTKDCEDSGKIDIAHHFKKSHKKGPTSVHIHFNDKQLQESSEEEELTHQQIIEASAILIQKRVRGFLCRLRLERLLEHLCYADEEYLTDNQESSEAQIIAPRDSGGRSSLSHKTDEREPSVVLTYGLRSSKKQKPRGSNGHENKHETNNMMDHQDHRRIGIKKKLELSESEKMSKTQKGFFVQKSKEMMEIAPMAQHYNQDSDSTPQFSGNNSSNSQKDYDIQLPYIEANSNGSAPRNSIADCSFRPLEQDDDLDYDRPKEDIVEDDIQNQEHLQFLAKQEYERWKKVGALVRQYEANQTSLVQAPGGDQLQSIFNEIESLALKTRSELKTKYNLEFSRKSLMTEDRRSKSMQNHNKNDPTKILCEVSDVLGASGRNAIHESKEYNSFGADSLVKIDKKGARLEKWVIDTKSNYNKPGYGLKKMGSTPLVEAKSISNLFEEIDKRNDEKLLRSSLNSSVRQSQRSRTNHLDSPPKTPRNEKGRKEKQLSAISKGGRDPLSPPNKKKSSPDEYLGLVESNLYYGNTEDHLDEEMLEETSSKTSSPFFSNEYVDNEAAVSGSSNAGDEISKVTLEQIDHPKNDPFNALDDEDNDFDNELSGRKGFYTNEDDYIKEEEVSASIGSSRRKENPFDKLRENQIKDANSNKSIPEVLIEKGPEKVEDLESTIQIPLRIETNNLDLCLDEDDFYEHDEEEEEEQEEDDDENEKYVNEIVDEIARLNENEQHEKVKPNPPSQTANGDQNPADFLLDELENDNYQREGNRNENEESDDSTDAETVYGIRTNFNAVNEYLSLLLKYLREKGMFILPNKKNDPTLILKRSRVLHDKLGEITNCTLTMDQAMLVKPQKRKKKEDKCFSYPISPEHFIFLKNFTLLENEILSNYLDMNIMEELFDMQKIYHRAIFDCFNEGLSKYIFETEMSLIDSIGPKRKTRENQNYGDLLEIAKEYVLDAASLLCGIIKDKEDSMMGNIRFMEDEFINQLREERMYRMITFENMEREKDWINKEPYIILVKKDLSKLVEDHIIEELVNDLNLLSQGERGSAVLSPHTDFLGAGKRKGHRRKGVDLLAESRERTDDDRKIDKVIKVFESESAFLKKDNKARNNWHN